MRRRDFIKAIVAAACAWPVAAARNPIHRGRSSWWCRSPRAGAFDVMGLIVRGPHERDLGQQVWSRIPPGPPASSGESRRQRRAGRLYVPAPAASAPMPTIRRSTKTAIRRRRDFGRSPCSRAAHVLDARNGSSGRSLPEFIASAKATAGKCNSARPGPARRRTFGCVLLTRRPASASRMFLSRRGTAANDLIGGQNRLHVRNIGGAVR